jgi:hypothetical protein
MDPLDKPGDLSVFGASEKPTLPADEMPENETVELKEEQPSLILPVEEAEEEEQQEEAAEPSLLQQALSQEKESSDAELTRLRQENARMQGELEGRRKAIEEQIRGTEPTPEPEKESLWQSPAVAGMLRRLQEEDPDQVLPAVMKVLEEEVGEKVSKEVQAVRDEVAQQQQARQQKELANQVLSGVHGVLANIKSEGGVAAEIIDDFYNRQEQSLLFQRFKNNEGIIYAGADGIRGAIMGIEAELRQRAQQSTPASVSPVAEESAGSGGASTRGVRLGEKPKKKTPEEQIADDIMSIGKRTSSIDFL